jgi:hypothetical protein
VRCADLKAHNLFFEINVVYCLLIGGSFFSDEEESYSNLLPIEIFTFGFSFDLFVF